MSIKIEEITVEAATPKEAISAAFDKIFGQKKCECPDCLAKEKEKSPSDQTLYGLIVPGIPEFPPGFLLSNIKSEITNPKTKLDHTNVDLEAAGRPRIKYRYVEIHATVEDTQIAVEFVEDYYAKLEAWKKAAKEEATP